MFEGMHRFLPALFKIEGFRVKEIPVNHRERIQGKSKYNMLNRGINTVMDCWQWSGCANAAFVMKLRSFHLDI